jgi:hypothetical protein
MNKKTKTKDEIDSFKQYISTNENVLDVVNIILLIEGCSKSDLNIKEVASWQVINKAMEKNNTALLTSSIISRSLSSFKYLNLEDLNSKQYMSLLWQRIKESKVVLNENDICASIYCLQSVDVLTPLVREIILYFATSIASTNASFPAKAICSAIYALKKFKPVNEVRELLTQISLKIEQSNVFFHSINVCIALNGLQSMDDSSAEVRRVMNALMDKTISAEEQGMEQACDREISMALFGFKILIIIKFMYFI